MKEKLTDLLYIVLIILLVAFVLFFVYYIVTEMMKIERPHEKLNMCITETTKECIPILQKELERQDRDNFSKDIYEYLKVQNALIIALSKE